MNNLSYVHVGDTCWSPEDSVQFYLVVIRINGTVIG